LHRFASVKIGKAKLTILVKNLVVNDNFACVPR
jgi:hypothetical protein